MFYFFMFSGEIFLIVLTGQVNVNHGFEWFRGKVDGGSFVFRIPFERSKGVGDGC